MGIDHRLVNALAENVLVPSLGLAYITLLIKAGSMLASAVTFMAASTNCGICTRSAGFAGTGGLTTPRTRCRIATRPQKGG